MSEPRPQSITIWQATPELRWLAQGKGWKILQQRWKATGKENRTEWRDVPFVDAPEPSP